MFSQLIQNLSDDTARSLAHFGPELAICGTIVMLLFARLISLRTNSSTWIALIGSAIGLWLATKPLIDANVLSGQTSTPIARMELFTGLLIYDPFTVFFRSLLMLFVVLFVLFTRLSGIPDREDGQDFYALVLGSTLGMCLMASANHMLIIFLGVEMASVPSYALAGMLKGRRQSSEAALKYAVYGAGAAGIMLYGISLLSGLLGSVHMPTMAHHLAMMLSEQSGLGDRALVLTLGGLMLGVGLAFKLSAVPFHFWCPDVFEGASAEVDAFLSVASKAAALALLVRVAIGLGTVMPTAPVAATSSVVAVSPSNGSRAAVAIAGERGGVLMSVPDAITGSKTGAENSADATTEVAGTAEEPVVVPATPIAAPAGTLSKSTADYLTGKLAPVRGFIALLVGLLSAVTCTFGNLAAYGQTNIKRLLAYSTIAHAGYMMMPVAAAMVLAGDSVKGTQSNAEAQNALAALAMYTVVYLFTNLGAFMVVAFVRNVLRSELIADYAGLIRRWPGVAICFSIILFSLIGLPPLAGFSAKFAIFASLVRAMKATQAGNLMLALLLIGGINTAISLFFYLRVIKLMCMSPEPENRLPQEFPLVSLRGGLLLLVTSPILILGIWWDDLYRIAQSSMQNLLS